MPVDGAIIDRSQGPAGTVEVRQSTRKLEAMSATAWLSADGSVVARERLNTALPFFTREDEWVASALRAHRPPGNPA